MSEKTTPETPVSVYRPVDDEGFVTITLKKPIQIAGVLTDTLKLREPTARDFRAVFSKKNTEKFSQQQLMMKLTAALASLSDDEFDQLTLADMTAATEAAESFA